jgi:hypothetical protein
MAQTSDIRLPLLEKAEMGAVVLVQADAAAKFPAAAKVDDAAFAQLGDQGYALVIDGDGVTLAARSAAGLRHAATTLAQIAADKSALPGVAIRDWPSMKYRGAQQDISRGQVPTPETMKRLADVMADGKMNVLEFYLEHVYKYKAFPDIAPAEGYSPEEMKSFAAYSIRAGVEMHPLLQSLGHGYHILSKPQYKQLAVAQHTAGEGISTFDVRKPEAVQMITTMIDELCEVLPGELFACDITEIDSEGLKADGMSQEQITDLVFDYVLKLNEAVKKHGKRLIIAQGPLDSLGHLSGMGPKLDQLPKDIIVGSYYCAGGPYRPAWEKDFPRFREKGIDFFAQPWIYSHMWLTPWLKPAAEFSDLEVSRGLQYGALGSVTTDWGDAGHYHFVGEEWLPYLYHGACAWTGAKVDRDYFRKACSRVVYGLNDDAAVRAMEAASDVNDMKVRVRDKDGKESEVATTFMWEFVHDPFTHPEITRLVDPAAVGKAILDATTAPLATLTAELPKAKRNKDNLEQWQFGVRSYVALGHKLVALGHYKDANVPRKQAAEELNAVADEFEALQADFKRLWLAEDRENDGFQDLLGRFNFTINACREKAKELQAS